MNTAPLLVSVVIVIIIATTQLIKEMDSLEYGEFRTKSEKLRELKEIHKELFIL